MSLTLLSTIEEVRRRVRQARLKGFRVGLVPTMGALHQGHGALMDRARCECGWTVVSIFVNPLQFGPGEDFNRYPRRLHEDLQFCAGRGMDAVFAPSTEVMYPQPNLSFVEVERLGDHLCGRSRPSHFRGVATVVVKLLNIVQPDRAYFGQKDAQQLAIIQRLVRDLNLELEIVSVETVRETDGLAVSSRNGYLSPDERKAAPALFQALAAMGREIEKGETEVGRIREVGLRLLKKWSPIRLDYLEIVDPDEMQPVSEVRGAVRVAVAAWLGSTRLIDNLLCRPPQH